MVNSISEIQDGKVTIEFASGKPYTYVVSDVEVWENDLKDVIEEGESVGQYVNRALRNNLLQLA